MYPNRPAIYEDALQIRILILFFKQHGNLYASRRSSPSIRRFLPFCPETARNHLQNSSNIHQVTNFNVTMYLCCWRSENVFRNEKGVADVHTSEILDGPIHYQELAVVRNVLLECGWSFYRSRNIAVVKRRRQATAIMCKRWRLWKVCINNAAQQMNVGKTDASQEAKIAFLETVDHGGCPVHWLWSFDFETS